MAWLTTLVCVLALAFSFAACKKDAEPGVITVENATDNQTLLSYMEALQEDGVLTFEIQSDMVTKMVTKINGVANFANSYWILYTTDTENSNTDWGTFAYNGQVLGSAALGAESLVVKNGETYVWSYETF